MPAAVPHLWRRRAPLPVLLAVLLPLGAACNSSPTSPDLPYAPYSQTDLEIGDGNQALPGLFVVVDYNAYLYQPSGNETRGRLVDSSLQRDPLGFTLGAGEVIPGFDQGVTGMRERGVRMLIVPPELAYGATGSGPIPPNATLVFEVALLHVTVDEAEADAEAARRGRPRGLLY